MLVQPDGHVGMEIWERLWVTLRLRLKVPEANRGPPDSTGRNPSTHPALSGLVIKNIMISWLMPFCT